MTRRQVKSWWSAALSNVTGDLATVAFRALMTAAAVVMVTGVAHLKNIWQVPEENKRIIAEQVRVAAELKQTLQENIKKIQDAEEMSRATLVTKAQLTQQMEEWHTQRDALNRTVEAHTKLLAEQSGKLDAIGQVTDKIWALLANLHTSTQ